MTAPAYDHAKEEARRERRLAWARDRAAEAGGPPEHVAARTALELHALHWGQFYYTRPVLSLAAAALTNLWEGMDAHGLTRDVLGDPESHDPPFIHSVLQGAVRLNRLNAARVELGPEGIRELLGQVHQAAGRAAGRRLTQGSLDLRDAGGHVVLGRLPETPEWGRRGDADLVVNLWRGDWIPGGSWEWVLYPHLPSGSGQILTVCGGPPGPELAEEVGEVAAALLQGRRLLPR